jgi:CxxC motif-containing protein (DUF1111 family)
MKTVNYLLIFVLSILFLSNCKEETSPYRAYLEEGEEFSGGETTIFDVSKRSFDRPAPNRNSDDDFKFIAGNAFFNRAWITAPSSSEGNDGLGPLFNARACVNCHIRDGRGTPPEDTNSPLKSMLVRLSIGLDANGNSIPDPFYGGQFNNQAVLGIAAEGNVAIHYEEIKGNYPDGTPYSLRKPTYSFYNLGYGPLSAETMISPRTAPFMIGLGLLEAISEETLESFADPLDIDKDGISGKINYVHDVVSGSKQIGRFGWKANQPNLKQQVAGAFNGDIGMTTSLFNNQNCAEGQIDCQNVPNGGDPELSDIKLEEVTFYSSMIAVPGRRDWENEEVLQGKALFMEAKCNACHIPRIETGKHATNSALSFQTIFPYTDLLLHDMGEELADNRPDYDANGNEWRTPPLWGTGLIETVNNHTNLLHDGRARNFEEAILWHGGEAENSKSTFMQMNKNERAILIKFLNSL